MTSIWLESLGRNFDEALDLLVEAMRDCTDDLWASSMWEVPADLFGPEPPAPTESPSLTQNAQCSRPATLNSVERGMAHARRPRLRYHR